MKTTTISLGLLSLVFLGFTACTKKSAEEVVYNDSNTPLHLMKPDYSTPYEIPVKDSIKSKLDLVLNFLNAATPAFVYDTVTGNKIEKFNGENPGARMHQGAFRLTSYEWGVTYSAMLSAGSIMADNNYTNYSSERLKLLSESSDMFSIMYHEGNIDPQMKKVVNPAALDDAGAICASMIRAAKSGLDIKARPNIERYINYIMNEEYRLEDGTFARNRPQHNSVWLDDMYMALPAIVEMGAYTGDESYYDEAANQILLFKGKMWLPEKKLFRHGWVENMSSRPSFHWGRANGWAILTISDVLDVLPESHKNRAEILQLYRDHVEGLSALQSGTGFWHQLLDRNDSYLETSATAIYTYALAHGINEGWLDPLVYGPVAILGWNAVSSKINSNGEVEGTCVGTGMGFDPAYYYHRPVHKFAAHGYGPAIYAGSEIYRLLELFHPKMNDSAVQMYSSKVETEKSIFEMTDPGKHFD